MEERQRNQIKSALLKCANENEGKGTYTGYVVVSSVCRSAEERIEELEKEKCELLGIIQGKDKAIKDLEWQLQEVLEDNDLYQKENAELIQENNVFIKDLGCDTCDIHLQYFKLNQKIAELEKENAELKELLEACKQERVEAIN